MKSVYFDRTLIYYDGPQVFVARDLSGSPYIGVLIEQSGESDKYVVVQVFGAFFEMFLRGEIDLLRLMLSRIGPGWYITKISDGFEGLMTLELQPNSLEDFPHLPKPGLYIKEAKDYFRDVSSGSDWGAIKQFVFSVDTTHLLASGSEFCTTPYLMFIPHHGSHISHDLGGLSGFDCISDSIIGGLELAVNLDPSRVSKSEPALAA